jgi:protein phosphatase
VKLTIPKHSLVLLVGVSGSGKSSFAKKHFRTSEIISSDYCRYIVCDDENDQSATKDAFEILHFIARMRLARGRLTVIDATNVQVAARKPLIALAGEYNMPVLAIVLNLSEQRCLERNQARLYRKVDPQIVRTQVEDLQGSLAGLGSEGLHPVFILDSPDLINSVEIDVSVSPNSCV